MLMRLLMRSAALPTAVAAILALMQPVRAQLLEQDPDALYTGPQPERVVVVANGNAAGSEELARYYMDKRGIPGGNLIVLDAPDKATIPWARFASEVFNPLRTRLLEDEWIIGQPGRGTDEAGRRKALCISHKIDYLVLVRGMPLRIRDEESLVKQTPEVPEHLRTVRASVDAELSLLAASEPTPVTGVVPNPLFGKRPVPPGAREDVVRVARLDGPSPAAVRKLVDNALEGERRGLVGRAYVDIGGPHVQGNEWMRAVGERLEAFGFEVDYDERKELFGEHVRFDAPIFYFGWWETHVSGPFLREEFEFPPGAVGFHLHSFSAANMRNPNRHWTGPLVERGITATVGNVFEPYLQLTHYPQALVEGLYRGMSFGEAAYFALPALSWQAIAVGDPLYRPFKVRLAEQTRNAAVLPPAESQYILMRRMELLRRMNRKEEAVNLAEKALDEAPGMPLALSLARLYVDEPRHRGKMESLFAFALEEDVQTAGNAALVAAAARLLEQQDHPGPALALYQKILTGSPLSDSFLLPWLEDAALLARRLDAVKLAYTLETRINRVKREQAAAAGAEE